MQGGETTAVRIRSGFEYTFEPGCTIFDEGDPGDQLYVIQTGEVELARKGVAGQRVVARLGPGEFFGELGVVLDRPRTTSAVAVSKSRVLQLDRETLEDLCMEQPEIAIRMIRILAGQLIDCEQRLAALGVDDLMRSVVRVLVRRAESPTGTGVDAGAEGIRIPVTLRGLSEAAGVSLLEAHRLLHQLFDRKVLHLVNDCLMTPDLEALTACVD